MSTRTSTALVPLVSVANVRAVAQFIEDTFVTTGGWVVSGDTGQTPPGSLTGSGTDTPWGFRIYKMNDVLQATAPIFVKMWFGSGSNLGNDIAIWFQVGTGSDGAGNLTGVIHNTTEISNSNNGSFANTSYGSADSNRCTFALFVQATASYFIVWGIERSKDASGADTGTGVILVYNSNITPNLDSSHYCIRAGGTQPSVETGLCYVLTTQTPSQVFAPGDIGVGIVIPIKGAAQQPGANFLITNNTDISSGGFITTTIYGATHTYQQLNAFAPKKRLAGSSTVDTNARCLMRFD
jgi:hypothetical protein